MPTNPAQPSQEYDVFLAYNSADKPFVRAIAEELRKRDLTVWFDEDAIPPGRPFQDAIQDAVRHVRSFAIFIGPSQLGRWQALELKTAISQCVQRGIPVIPVLLPGVRQIPDGSPLLAEFNSVRFDENASENENVERLVWGITGQPPRPATMGQTGEPPRVSAPSATPPPEQQPWDSGKPGRSRRVIFGLHGIRTDAAWTRALCDVASAEGWQVRMDRWNYGYFSLLRFLLPRERSAKVRWFRQAYHDEVNDRRVLLDKGRLPSIVAHSFGTYILGNALLKYDWLRFDKVILCGSILPPDFPWEKLIERGQVQAVRNEYGVQDIWSGLVRWFVGGTGPSGRDGFRCSNTRFEQERFEYTHSEYFEKGHMEAKWLPFLRRVWPALPAIEVSVARPRASRPWAKYAFHALLLFVLVNAATGHVQATRSGALGLLAQTRELLDGRDLEEARLTLGLADRRVQQLQTLGAADEQLTRELQFCQHRLDLAFLIRRARDLSDKGVDQGNDGKSLYAEALTLLDRALSQAPEWQGLNERAEQSRDQILNVLADGDAESARQLFHRAMAGFEGPCAAVVEWEDFLNVRSGVKRNSAYLQSRDPHATGYESLLLDAGLGYVQLAFFVSDGEAKTRYLGSGAECLRELGNLKFKRGEDHLARRYLRAAMTVYEIASTESEGLRDARSVQVWAALLISNGRVLEQFRCYPDAAGAFEAARKLLEPIKDSRGLTVKEQHAVAQMNRGFCEYELGLNRTARTSLTNARTAFVGIMQSDEDQHRALELRGQRSLCSVFLGSALRELGEKDKAGNSEAIRECEEAKRGLDGWYDPNVKDHESYAEAYYAALNALGWAYLSAGDLDKAKEIQDEACDHLAKLAGDHPNRHYARDALAWAYRHRACVYLDAGGKEQAEEYFRKAISERMRLRLDDAEDRAKAGGKEAAAEGRYTYDLIWLLVHCELPELRQPPWALTLAQGFGDLQQRRGRFGDMLAAALYRNGQYKECVQALEEEQSQNGFDLLILALARSKLGQTTDAKTAYEEAERERVVNWAGSREFQNLLDEARPAPERPVTDQPVPAGAGQTP